MKKLTNMWYKIPVTWRDYIISSITTFVATFLLIISLQISSDEPIQWTASSIGGLLLVAVRGAFRSVAKHWVPILRDKK